MAMTAGREARANLKARGIADPDAQCGRLLESLENAVAGAVAAVELDWPVAPRAAHLAEVRRRLQLEPLEDRPPEPPKLFSRRLLQDLTVARHARDASSTLRAS